MQSTRNIQSASVAMPRYRVSVARSASEIEAAQRLRYAVFAEEQGARIGDAVRRIDSDRFDEACDHVIVRDTTTDEVVGTYRMLAGHKSRLTRGFYSEQEFDLGGLSLLRAQLCELGRACIAPEHRSGAVMLLLWAGIADYAIGAGCEYFFGCASVSLADGGRNASALYRQLVIERLSPSHLRAYPRAPLPLSTLTLAPRELKPVVPPLFKGYLRLNAMLCGEPAWDPDFNTADFLLLVPIAGIERRYARHYVERRPSIVG